MSYLLLHLSNGCFYWISFYLIYSRYEVLKSILKLRPFEIFDVQLSRSAEKLDKIFQHIWFSSCFNKPFHWNEYFDKFSWISLHICRWQKITSWFYFHLIREFYMTNAKWKQPYNFSISRELIISFIHFP